MKINVEKCDTILFRPTVDKCAYDIRTNWKSFETVSIHLIAKLRIGDGQISWNSFGYNFIS